ncbi:hypothetical protein [Negadavirga shengliensis]|uniref:Uncharacterized protein n=1 Tax=Negadavirga shengliensis TaxID=1389218 RepID=A0ABV9T9D8_9BACT
MKKIGLGKLKLLSDEMLQREKLEFSWRSIRLHNQPSSFIGKL